MMGKKEGSNMDQETIKAEDEELARKCAEATIVYFSTCDRDEFNRWKLRYDNAHRELRKLFYSTPHWQSGQPTKQTYRYLSIMGKVKETLEKNPQVPVWLLNAFEKTYEKHLWLPPGEEMRRD